MSKIILYVDGACRGNPGLGGWGVYLQQGEQVHQYCGGEVHTTNNRMELTAAIEGILQCPSDVEVQLFTDSSYVKNGITTWLENWKKKNWKDIKNPDLWKILDSITQQRKIDWHWIKGHAGHFGNEMADQLANLGADLVKEDGKKEHQVFCVDNENIIHMRQVASVAKNLAVNASTEQSSEQVTEQSKKQATEQTNSINDWLLDDPLGFDDMPMENDEIVDDNINDKVINEENIDNQIDHLSQDMADELFDSHHDVAPNDEPKKKKKSKKKKRPTMPAEQVAQHIIITPATKDIKGKRQLILDTETTGFYYHNGDRIIEIGAIEMINRKLTGSSIHIYIQPEKEVGESVTVHGITDEFLQDKPIFSEVATILYDYLKGAEIVAHNATFDMSFLDAEFELAGFGKLSDVCSVVDTLAMAKAKHGGQRNSLDALAKRYEIVERDRTFHGALLDAEILADVYLAMTGGQVALDIQDTFLATTADGVAHYTQIQATLPIIFPSEEELQAHQQWQQQKDKKYPDVEPSIFYQLENPDWRIKYDERQAELELERQQAEEEARRLKEEQELQRQQQQKQQAEPSSTET